MTALAIARTLTSGQSSSQSYVLWNRDRAWTGMGIWQMDLSSMDRLPDRKAIRE